MKELQYPDVRSIVPREEQPRMLAVLSRFEAVLGELGQQIGEITYVSGRRRAFVFEIRTKSADGPVSYFLKFGVRMDREILEYVNGEASRTYRVYEEMAGSDTFRVTEPIARYEDLAAFALRGDKGRRLDLLIKAAARRMARANDYEEARRYCSLAARWLTYFQDHVGQQDSDPRTSADAMLARAEREVVVLSLSAPGRVSGADCRAIRENFARLVDGLQPADLVAAARHNDFAPWNILCADESVCVIDYADLTEGCRYFDAYQFVDAMHVLSQKVFVSKPAVLRLQHEFLKDCEVVAHASKAADQYYTLLCKLIRINALLNNARTGVAVAVRNRRLLSRYLREVLRETRAESGSGLIAGREPAMP